MRYIKTLNELEKFRDEMENAKTLGKEIESIFYILEDEGYKCKIDIKCENYVNGLDQYKMFIGVINPKYNRWNSTEVLLDYEKLVETDHYFEFIDRCSEVCKEYGYFLLPYKLKSMYNTSCVGIVVRESHGKSIKNAPSYNSLFR